MAGADRRGVIAGLLALAAAPGGAAVSLYPGADAIRPALRKAALAAMMRHGGRLTSRDRFAVVDFAAPSAVPRLHLVDLLAGTTTSLLCAHGRGSDPAHSGYVQGFSNVEGSLASSEGAYLTAEEYQGRNGRSGRLVGLDPSNDAALRRLIVIHGAPYATADVAGRQGRLGRSDGCFAVPPDAIDMLLDALRPGRLLFAGR